MVELGLPAFFLGWRCVFQDQPASWRRDGGTLRRLGQENFEQGWDAGSWEEGRAGQGALGWGMSVECGGVNKYFRAAEEAIPPEKGG